MPSSGLGPVAYVAHRDTGRHPHQRHRLHSYLGGLASDCVTPNGRSGVSELREESPASTDNEQGP